MVQSLAKGEDYQAQIPAGPSHGKRVEVHVPKILSDGTTARTAGSSPRFDAYRGDISARLDAMGYHHGWFPLHAHEYNY